MKRARSVTLAVWLLAVVLASVVVAHARFSADLSAFLPRAPSATQQVLVDQLQNGLAAHLILIGIEGGDAVERAQAARALTAGLSRSATSWRSLMATTLARSAIVHSSSRTATSSAPA